MEPCSYQSLHHINHIIDTCIICIIGFGNYTSGRGPFTDSPYGAGTAKWNIHVLTDCIRMLS